MAKARKRAKKSKGKGKGPAGKGPNLRMPPPGGPFLGPDGFCGRPPLSGEFHGPPPHPMGPPGPRFPMGPPRPLMLEEEAFLNDASPYPMRGNFMHGDFPPPQFSGGPRFPHPDFNGGPFDCAPQYFAGRPKLRPEFCRQPHGPGFGPAEFRGGPPGFQPPMGVHGNPGFGITEGFYRPPPGPGKERVVVAPATTADSQQISQQNKSENTKTDTSKTATSTLKNASRFVKPPPGRSVGVISFIGNNYGFIEREDLKKFSFSFDAFFGKREHLVPGVKVHFTAVKELGKECATDVKVPPGGTEEVDEKVYEGVVITTLPETYVMENHPGRIRTILSTDPVKLSFGKMDTKVTLLLFDRVKFQLLTDVITKVNRATNIIPQIPETFQLTKEIRERGMIMNIKGDVCTVMSKMHENLSASVDENVSDDDLTIMDEVEFTTVTVKNTTKAIRLKKLPNGSVAFDLKTQNKIAEAKEKISDPSSPKDKWKPVTSDTVSEKEKLQEISSEKYEGTIVKVIPKNVKKLMEEQEPPQGLLDSMVSGTQKRLPFSSEDVITLATMMVGDKVNFKIFINKETKQERAVNIEIQPDHLQPDSAEKRSTGVIVKLDENTGFIKTPQDPQLIFELSEVMEATKLTLSEKVEFTLAVNEGAPKIKRAIRIKRLTESVFTAVPKLGCLGEKEKKKMTIKLLSNPNELMKKEVKTEDKVGGLVAAKKPGKRKAEAIIANESIKDTKGKQEKGKGTGESSRSREDSRRRHSRSRSRSRNRSRSSYKRHRSSVHEKSYSSHRLSRSHSRDRGHRYRSSKSRSLSRSSDRSDWRRSRSPEHKDGHHRRRSNSKDHSSKTQRRSPDKVEGLKTVSKFADSSSSDSLSADGIDVKLTKKRIELQNLNELIARKRAIIAMKHNTRSYKDVIEMDKQHGFATFDYQHKTCVDNTWMADLHPTKSILKKHPDPLSDPKHQASKRSMNPVELVEYPKINPYIQAWSQHDSSPETEDQELTRKKRQLEELGESIARKRAIVAMKQKALSEEMEMEKDYDFALCSDNLDISVPVKNSWQLDSKLDHQPKKSILKKHSEPLGQSQIDAAHCKTSQDDFSKSTGPPNIVVEKSTNSPNSLGIFKKLMKNVSATSHASKSAPFSSSPDVSFCPASTSGQTYNQKSTREAKASCSYDSPSHSQNNQFLLQAHDQSSTSDLPSAQPSTSTEQKRNLATQMQRFLSAVSKADSNLLSSLLREARKDSCSVESPKNPEVQPDKNVPYKDELYDPFKEAEDNEGDDDLLPHERALQDGSGFSKLVGMKYGAEKKTENPFIYEETKASFSQSRFSEAQTQFSECDQNELHQNHSEIYQNPYLRVQDSCPEKTENYERRRELEKCKVEGNLSPVHQKSEDASEAGVKKTEQYEKIQNLLQTIGLKLDTVEVIKLADRTKERLYGKKVKSPCHPSQSQSSNQSESRYNRRSSREDSTDSEGVQSASPTRSSNREVYMSYLDSVRHQSQHDDDDEVSRMKERDLLNLKMTIKNTREARQVTTKVTTESYNPATESTNFLYTPVLAESSSATPYPESGQNFWQSSYHLVNDQNSYSQDSVSPYGLVPPSHLPYPAGIQVQPPPVPPNYGYYATPLFPVPPPFSSPPPFGLPPAPINPPPASQFNVPMQPGGSSFNAMLTLSKPTAPARCLKQIETVSTEKPVAAKPEQLEVKPALVGVQPALIRIQPVEEFQPKGTQRKGESKQAGATTEDDIRAKQKKRLEQFNQRMRLKKEQQLEAQRARGQSLKLAPGKVTRKEVKNVWICGHSLVFWAEKRATSPEIGMQLGMDPNSVRIWWKGVQGMTWQQLLPHLLQLKDNWPKPDVILMHLGGNDIGKSTPDAFLAAVKKDLISMKSIFPECLLVWSDILPRRSWRHSDNSVEVDNTRKAMNKSISSIITELGGLSIPHENIKPGLNTGLYRPDGVHLSGKGIDTFNLNMQDFLEKWESELNEKEPLEN